MTKKLKEFKNWIEEHEEDITMGAIVVSGCFACYALGIFTGKTAEAMLISKGLDKCCEVDSTLKERLANAIAETYKKQMME